MSAITLGDVTLTCWVNDDAPGLTVTVEVPTDWLLELYAVRVIPSATSGSPVKPTKALTVRAVGFRRPTVRDLKDSASWGMSPTWAPEWARVDDSVFGKAPSAVGPWKNTPCEAWYCVLTSVSAARSSNVTVLVTACAGAAHSRATTVASAAPSDPRTIR